MRSQDNADLAAGAMFLATMAIILMWIMSRA